MRLSLLLLATLALAQNPNFEFVQTHPGTGPLGPIAHLRSQDGGRFVVSSTLNAYLPLDRPFQAVHSGSSIALSSDAGRTFQPIEVPGISQVTSLAFGSRSPQLRYALGDRSSFAISTDAGSSWRTLNSTNPLFFIIDPILGDGRFRDRDQLVVDPRDERIVYRKVAGFGSSVFTLPGFSFFSQWSELLAAFVPVAGLPSDASGPYLKPASTEVYAATTQAIFRSLGPGAAWERFSVLPPGQHIRDIVFDAHGTQRIYVLTQAGQVLLSSDDGQSWRALEFIPGIRNFPLRIQKIATNPYRPGHTLFLGTSLNFQTVDGSTTFTAIRAFWPAPLPGSPIQAILLNPENLALEFDASDTNIVYAESRTRISRDAGLTWQDHDPGRIGRRVCSPLQSNVCYAIGDRFHNFYIQKFSAAGQLQWASYWGNDRPDMPRDAFVGSGGDLWLSTGKSVTRISPSGVTLDSRKVDFPLLKISQTENATLIGILENPNSSSQRIATLDPHTLAPSLVNQIFVSSPVRALAPKDSRIAFTTGQGAGVWNLQGSTFQTIDLPESGSINVKALAWSSKGDLILAGDRVKEVSARRSKVEIYTWNGAQAAKFATLEGEASESVEHVEADPSGRFWVLGSTSSQRFPTAYPLWNGPRRGGVSSFLSLFAERAFPIFSTYVPNAALPLASAESLDLLSFSAPSADPTGGALGAIPIVGGLAPYQNFALPSGNYSTLQLKMSPPPALLIEAVERRFDSSGGDWSKGSWIRVRSRDLADLKPFALPLWSSERPKSHEGAALLLDGRPLTILAAGPSFLEAVIDSPEIDGNTATRVLLLERNGRSSQRFHLGLDPFDFELLPSTSNAETALCYNADGTENSEANPATANSQVTLFGIGALDSREIYLRPAQIGDYDESDRPTYRSDYVEDVPGVLPGIRYIGLTLKGLGRFTGTRKAGLYRYYEDQPSLYIWVKN